MIEAGIFGMVMAPGLKIYTLLAFLLAVSFFSGVA